MAMTSSTNGLEPDMSGLNESPTSICIPSLRLTNFFILVRHFINIYRSSVFILITSVLCIDMSRENIQFQFLIRSYHCLEADGSWKSEQFAYPCFAVTAFGFKCLVRPKKKKKMMSSFFATRNEYDSFAYSVALDRVLIRFSRRSMERIGNIVKRSSRFDFILFPITTRKCRRCGLKNSTGKAEGDLGFQYFSWFIFDTPIGNAELQLQVTKLQW